MLDMIDNEYSSENSSESNSNISSDEMFEDNIMMNKEEAEDIVNKLLEQRKKLKRPLVYIGNSIRTYQRKRLESKKMAIGSAHITDFFRPNNNLDQSNKSSKENSFNNNDKLENSESDDKRCQDAEIINNENDKNIKNAIERIENLIKYEKPQKVELVQYQSVVGYLRKHSSKSLLHDESVCMCVADYLRSNKFKVSFYLVKQYLEENIFLDLGFDIPQTKGIYVDGHECPDVVAYQNKFLNQIVEYELLIPKWLAKECKIRTSPMLDLNQKLHILVTHDESTFYAYNRVHAFWGPQGEQPLRKKGTVIMALGANKDSYWNSEWLLKQPKMHSTKWNGHDQEMVYPLNHLKKKLRGQAKGMKAILEERGLWQDGLLAEYETCKKKKIRILKQ
ncbi:7217_t:CDS:2 [Cetraspora pellucida]|uniref:7217_t:CDS:1 n=1 Tax=Cetraspora pellucida TaxID=1433469 RepID=A0A9N9A069_9GLOM|nr:7217_t:CDS:2 [Cetraspora pellucida]